MTPPTPAGVRIRLRGCSKSFGTQTVLRPLDLEIKPAETLVLLGPSGCGKTTTLRLIAGLDFPDAGHVLFDDEDVTDLPIEKRNVGMVFQSYALFPNMNVQDNVGYGLRIRGMPAEQRAARVQEMLAMVQIAALAKRGIHELSGGQRQRVALARAMAAQPRVLLLDEPLSALDARLREDLRHEIGSLLKSLRTTAVYVTHDQAEAMALGDRIAIMERGQLAQLDVPRAVYQEPLSEFVADFMGHCNRVGDLRFRPEDAELVAADGARLRGKVSNMAFFGDHLRLHVVIESTPADAPPVLVKVPVHSRVQLGAQVGIQVRSSSGVST